MLAIVGFALFLVWFIKEMKQFYCWISGNVEVRPIGNLLITGLILFALAWIWSLVTSISLLREALSVKEQALRNFAATSPSNSRSRFFEKVE